MNVRFILSGLLAAANLVAVLLLVERYHIGGGATFLGLIVAVAASAVVQRLRFGREAGWRARLDPVVVIAFLIGFDLILALAIAVRAP